MKDKKTSLLKALEERMQKNDLFGEMSVFTAEELDSPVDILRAEISEFGPDLFSVLGEFFFLPLDDENLEYFSIILTISHRVPPEAAADIASAAARLNYYVPLGDFALGDDDRNLIYRYTALLSPESKPDSKADFLYQSLTSAISQAERYVGYLLLVLKNEITVEEMTDMLSGKT